MSGTAERIASADEYLAARTGCYQFRCERYDAALTAMYGLGLDDSCTVLDIGAGWHEFGCRMYEGRWIPDEDGICERHPCRARYWPVDAALDGTDLDQWSPVRKVEYIVALEVLEHLHNPVRLLRQMMAHATRGVLVSTPNPETVDVLAIDSTHVQPIARTMLEREGMLVEESSFYGQPADSLLGVWSPLFVY